MGRLDKCIWMAESLCCSPEIIITLLIGYIPIQNKKFKKIKRSEEHRQMVQSLVPIPRYLKKKYVAIFNAISFFFYYIF